MINSADLNRHVRAKILFIENGEKLLNNSDVTSLRGGCCSAMFGGSKVTQLHMRMKLVTGQCQSLHPGYAGAVTEERILMNELLITPEEELEVLPVMDLVNGKSNTTNTANTTTNTNTTNGTQTGDGLKATTSIRFKILQWLEVQHLSIKHLAQDSRAIFEILDPDCTCKECRDTVKEEKHRMHAMQKRKKEHKEHKESDGKEGEEEEEEEHKWSGHVYGWSCCSLFDYAKCYIRERRTKMRMYPGTPPRELVLQAEASEMDRIELDVNDTHPYLTVMFEDFEADIVFSESWKLLAQSR